MEAKLIGWLLLLLKEQREDGPKILTTCVLGVFLAVCLLLSFVTYALTSPVEFVGLLGDVQLELADRSFRQSSLTPLEEEQIAALAGQFSDPRQRDLFHAALSLVGRVPYFWGGKSGPGWNEDWGTPRLVTAPGVSSSGSIRPYGLDCSGYVAWAFDTAGITDALQRGGTGWQWNATTPIEEAELRPGDLAFKQPPSHGGVNHVGIYFGVGEDGKKLFLHCSAGDGGVTLNSYAGLHYFRRLKGVFDD